MMTLLADFHFLRPWWLLLLLPLPAWLWWWAHRGGAAAALARLVDAPLLPHLLEGHGRRRRGSLALVALALVLAMLALAGPSWKRLPQPLYGSRAAQVVVLSLSPRMLARDVAPDRLTRARYKVHDLLAANADGRNGLVAYAGAAFVVAPLTSDAHALSDLLNALAPEVMPVPGDAPAEAIALGAQLLRQGDAGNGLLVLVTDAANDAAVAAARQAHAQGVRVSVLGVGGTQGEPVKLPHGGFLQDADGAIVMARRDDVGLRALAAAGGGRYVPMRADQTDIRALATQLRADDGSHVAATQQVARWRDAGPWLLLPLLPLAALAFRRGWMLSLTLILLLPPWSTPAQAAPVEPAPAASSAAPAAARDASAASAWQRRWAALWLNADQRAQRALAAGHATRAQKLARDPALRGAADYRAGDYVAAAQAFADADGSDGAYNRGNALARQGHYQDAIAAWTRALKRDPHNRDAAANRKAVQDWLRRQRQTPPPRSGRAPKPSAAGQGSGSSRQNMPAGAASSSTPAKASSAPVSSPAPASSTARQPAAPAPASSVQPPGAAANPAPSGSAPPPAATQTPATAARQRAQAARATQAQKTRMDRALEQASPYALGSQPARGASVDALPPSMQRALQRVPDDPGSLLRRKFQLEYQQRQGNDAGGNR